MKKTTKLLALFMAMLMVFALGLSACGSKSEEPAADEGQNPAMNFVGNYVCGRAAILIGATDEENGMNATVTWSSSAAENSTWVMSGTFDPETLQFEYHDCVRTDYVYSEDGEVASQEEVFTGGHGFMFFKEGDPLSLTWQDDQEKVAEDMVFEYAGANPENNEAGMANPWSDVDSAEAAAEGAGLDTFMVPDGEAEISLGEVKVTQYRCMKGMAEAVVEFPAVEMTIRKGDKSGEMAEGDISGDYNEYEKCEQTEQNGAVISVSYNSGDNACRTLVSDQGYSWSLAAPNGYWGDSAQDFLNLILN